MSKPILYYNFLSPPARAALLAAKAVGVEVEVRNVDLLTRQQYSEEYLKLNPQHTVPVLDDNGIIIIDSHVIAGYLSDKYGKNDELYPKDAQKRALIDARMYFETSFLFARLRFVFEPILLLGGNEYEPKKFEYIQKAWPLMEAILENSDYVAGDTMTIADFSCAASVTSVDKIAPIDPIKYPKFTAWLKRMEQFPDYAELNLKGANILQEAYFDAVKESRIKAENA